MAAPPPQDLDQEVKESRKRFKAFFDQDVGSDSCVDDDWKPLPT